MKPRQPDWCRVLLAADWLVKHLTLQALLPGLTPGEVKAIKRRERAARQQRRYALKKAVEEIRATLARWEKHEPKKPARPARPVQLRLPL